MGSGPRKEIIEAMRAPRQIDQEMRCFDFGKPASQSQAVIESGLEGGELVVTEGHLQITEGSRVSAREPKAGL